REAAFRPVTGVIVASRGWLGKPRAEKFAPQVGAGLQVRFIKGLPRQSSRAGDKRVERGEVFGRDSVQYIVGWNAMVGQHRLLPRLDLPRVPVPHVFQGVDHPGGDRRNVVSAGGATQVFEGVSLWVRRLGMGTAIPLQGLDHPEVAALGLPILVPGPADLCQRVRLLPITE